MSDIEQIMDHYGFMYRTTSGNQPIKCPVHEDSVASATLNIGKGVFNCHACGAAGDGISLVMQREGMEFAPALRFVEEITGGSRSRTRGKPQSRKPVPPGEGYRPRVFRKVPTGSRKRIEYA